MSLITARYEISTIRTASELKMQILNNLMNEIHQIANELGKKYQPIMKAKIDEAINMAAQKFYDAYDNRRYYDPTGSLYRVLTAKVEENLAWRIEDHSEEEFSGHHQDWEIIYNNVFIGGYHGGSLGRPDIRGVSPAGISWRSPEKIYKYWGRRAISSDPPYDLFNKYIDEAVDEVERLAQAEYDKMSLNAIQEAKQRLLTLF